MNRLHIDEGFGGLIGSFCSDSAYADKTTCEAATKVWTEGSYIVIEGYEIVDPTAYTDVYNDMFLKRYVTALIKRQWGQNMSKFEGMMLPGGVTMNGLQIYQDAVEEINKLEEEMQLAWQLPDDFLMG
jgi:mannitol-1-phosphate/altronate dehydrogenase